MPCLGFDYSDIYIYIYEGSGLPHPFLDLPVPSWLQGRERVHIFEEDSQTVAFNSAALFFNLRFFVEAQGGRAVES